MNCKYGDFLWGLEKVSDAFEKQRSLRSGWKEKELECLVFTLLLPPPLSALWASSCLPQPPLASSIPYLKFHWRAELGRSPHSSGQRLKHCHKSAAHCNATLKQCERLVSVAPALSLYGRLWLFSVKRPCGVI